MKYLFCQTLLFLSLPMSCLPADWPEFRGPTGQGHSSATNLPTEWSPAKNIAWKQVIPGQGWSSPILLAGKLYLTTALKPEAGGDQSLRLICLEADSGKVLWSKEIFSVPTVNGHAKNSHASPTPLTDGRIIYVHFGHYGTAAVDLSGKIVWRNDSIKYSPVHGNGGSPVLVDGRLVFSCDGQREPFIVALDAGDGSVVWRTRRSTEPKKPFSFSTPLVIETNDRKEIISPASAGLFAYDPKDGHELWRVRYEEGYSVVPRPVFGHGLLFVSSSFDRPVVYAVRPGGNGDVTDTHIVWSIRKSAPNTPSPLLVGDDLYFISDGGIMTCAEARTGKVHWQERIGGNFSASPSLADGKIYIQSEEGVGTVLSPGHHLNILARNELGERTLASLAFGDSTIYLRAAEHLYCIRKSH